MSRSADDDAAGAPERQRVAGDAAHVAACIKAGGFPVLRLGPLPPRPTAPIKPSPPAAAARRARATPPPPPPAEPQPAVRFTPELAAHAVIAAARVYGDDPARAMTARGGPLRRCLAPAALGLEQATGAPRQVIATAIGCRASNLWRARSVGGEPFEQALRAAAVAVRRAGSAERAP